MWIQIYNKVMLGSWARPWKGVDSHFDIYYWTIHEIIIERFIRFIRLSATISGIWCQQSRQHECRTHFVRCVHQRPIILCEEHAKVNAGCDGWRDGWMADKHQQWVVSQMLGQRIDFPSTSVCGQKKCVSISEILVVKLKIHSEYISFM